MNALVFVTLLCCFVAIQANLKIVQCPGRRAITVTKLEVDGCTDYPCALKRGRNSTVRMEFTTAQRVNGLKLKIAGIIGGAEVPFSINDADHCRKTVTQGGRCPLVKGRTYKYQFSLPVLEQYPKVSVVIKYDVHDLLSKSVLCIRFPAQLV